MITANSIIEKIVFDVTIDGETFKGVTLDYTPEQGWCLRASDIHYEENDSWCMFEVGGETYDCQFFGEDDSFAYADNINTYDDDLAMQIPIHAQLCLMELEDNGCYSHTDTWLYTPEVKFENVQIHTNDGVENIEIH